MITKKRNSRICIINKFHKLSMTEAAILYLIHVKLLSPILIKGGVQAFQFRKHDFDLWVGGDGLDMYQQL